MNPEDRDRIEAMSAAFRAPIVSMTVLETAVARRARRNAKRDRDGARSTLGRFPLRPASITPEDLAATRERLRVLLNRAKVADAMDWILPLERAIAEESVRHGP